MRARRTRASAGSTGCEPGWPTGASSSHCGKGRARLPDPRWASRAALLPPASSAAAPSASRRGPGSPPAAPVRRAHRSGRPATSSSRARAMACEALGGFFRRLRQFKPSSRASPKALGTKGRPGRTKANSSSTSNSSTLARVPSRPATKAAWATRTSPPSNSGRASCRPMRSAAPSARAIAAPGGAGTRAIRESRESGIGARF